jgi:hypothetical protein
MPEKSSHPFFDAVPKNRMKIFSVKGRKRFSCGRKQKLIPGWFNYIFGDETKKLRIDAKFINSRKFLLPASALTPK